MRPKLKLSSGYIATIKRSLMFVCLVIFCLFAVYTYTRVISPVQSTAYAAESSNLSFQARLYNSDGSVVDDGFYDVEFKIYNVDTGGSALWTETRNGGNQVRVVNGYFSVNLGSVTAFPATIQWDQEHWMTLNVNSDGEMTPRIKLTAVPYAFQASEAKKLIEEQLNGTGTLEWASLTTNRTATLPDASGTVLLDSTGFANGGNTFGGTATLGTNDSNDLILETGGVEGLRIDQDGDVGIGTLADAIEALEVNGGIKLGNTINANSGTIRWTGTDFEGYDGSGWVSLTGGGSSGALNIAFIQAYDNSGGTNLNSGTPTAVPWDQETNKDTGFTHDNVTNNSRITLDDAGWYKVTYNVVGNTPGGNRSNIFCQARFNGSTNVSTSVSLSYSRQTGDPGTSNTASFYYQTSSANEYYEIMCSQNGSAGTVSAVAGQSYTIAEKAVTGGGGGGTFFEQNGNSFGTTAVLGTTDSNGLSIITDSSTALEFTSAGAATFYNGLTINTGNLNLNSNNLTNAGAISATSFSGDGSGLTDLNGSNIATGTIDDARLSGNVSLLDATQTFTSLNTFSGALNLGNTADTTAGNIRWTGTDFEGYDGSGWVSLTGGGNSLLDGVLAFGKVNGTTGSALTIDGATVVRNSTGNYTVTLDNVATTSDYIVQLTVEEDANQDDINISLNNQTTAGFDVDVREGDNSTTADTPTDKNWHFVVFDADAAAGGGAGGGGVSFDQGGNAFGSTAILGTTDTNGLQIVTNGSAALQFTSGGVATFNYGLNVTGGDLDLNSNDLVNAGAISATSFSGNGSGLTDLNGSSIATGTIDDARLSSNVALLDATQSYSQTQTFSGGAVLGNFTSSTAGAIRWTGADFEGFDGTQWLSLTGGGLSSSGDYISVTVNSNSNASTAVYDAFESGNYASYSSTTNASNGIVYTPADGRYTIATDGTYNINANYLLESSAIAFVNLIIRVNGADVYNEDVFIHSSVDPVERSVDIVKELTAGDYVEFLVDGTTGNITVHGGTTATVVPVSSAGGGGGGGGGGTSFEQNGNAFGSTAILGTTDANGLRFITNNSTALEFTSGGAATLYNGLEINAGDLDLNSNDLTNGGAITATSFSGNGSGLTNLDGSNIATGTIDDARLSSDVILANAGQTFTSKNTFSAGLTLGNSGSTDAGTIRWTGTDFEGFDGVQWLSLTQSASPGAPLLQGVLAFGKVNGSTGAAFSIDGATVVRNGTGDYTVTLDTAATSSDYIVQLTVEEGANQDDINISIDSQSTTSFDVDIREGDNGGTADVAIDKNWHFVVFDADAAAGGGAGGGTSFDQGGNAFGSTAVLGTTDPNGLSIITNGSAAAIFDSSGNVSFTQEATFNSNLYLGTATTLDATAQALFYSGGASNKGLVVQGASSQSANLFEVQNSSGDLLSAFTSNGGLVLGQSTFATSATSARTITFSDETGTVCLDTNNCGYFKVGDTSITNDNSTNDSIAINKTSTGNLIRLQNSGTDVFEVLNSGAVEVQLDSANAFRVMNSSGTDLFNIDTSTNVVSIGSLTGDGTGVLFVLDTKNTTGDPTGIDGGQYYNSALGKFRCYEDGEWKDCIGTRQIRSFIDTTSDAVVDNDTTDYWDTSAENNNSYPNITPSSTSKAITASIVLEVLESGSSADRIVQSRVERGIGSPPTCGSGTVVGPILSNFTTNNNQNDTVTIVFVDEPATTSTVYYTICSDSNTSSASNMSVTRMRASLEEANNSN